VTELITSAKIFGLDDSGHKLQERKLWSEVREIFFTLRVIAHWELTQMGDGISIPGDI